MPIRHDELLPEGLQDRNAGNAGDLGKHGVYLSLLETLRRTPPWSGGLQVVEAHAGKGLYAAGDPQWKRFQEKGHRENAPLVNLQRAVLGPQPFGVGPILGLPAGDNPYVGSSVLHASLLSDCPGSSLVCYDCDPNVRCTLQRVLEEACFRSVRSRVEILDPFGQSEPVVLEKLRHGCYGRRHVLHLDPFAFVMGKDDQPTRDRYRYLLQECDARVAEEKLGAASVFVTWGSNGSAARQDLFMEGYEGGLHGGFQDLRGLVRSTQSVVIAWCWKYYFSLIVVVPERLRHDLMHSIMRGLACLAASCSYFSISE
jgi:hypothetical protein